jgi:hypothetical protein
MGYSVRFMPVGDEDYPWAVVDPVGDLVDRCGNQEDAEELARQMNAGDHDDEDAEDTDEEDEP